MLQQKYLGLILRTEAMRNSRCYYSCSCSSEVYKCREKSIQRYSWSNAEHLIAADILLRGA